MPLILSAARSLRKRGLRRPASWLARLAATFENGNAEAVGLLFQIALERGDFPAAERECRRLLAIRPDDPAVLHDLGHLALRRGATGEAAAWFHRHDAQMTGAGVVTQVLRKEFLDIDLARSGQPYLKSVENVLVDTAYWTIMKDGIVYSDDTHGKNLFNSPLVHGRISPDGASVIASYMPPRTTIDKTCIFVGGDENYSHWLFRNLLKLSALDREGLLHSHPWLVNRDLRPHQRQYLDLLGIGPDDLAPVDRNDVILCRKLIVPALLTSTQAIDKGMDWIRGKLAARMAAPESASHLIYVSRRDSPRRVLLNEQDLFARLSPRGFDLVVPGELSVVEQIRAFSGARLIVAAHGAALTNIIFAPRDAAIVEITSTAIKDMDDFRKIARTLGQRMRTVVCGTYPAGAGTIHVNSDYLADIDAVLQAVEELSR